jgi:hypothetical protein
LNETERIDGRLKVEKADSRKQGGMREDRREMESGLNVTGQIERGLRANGKRIQGNRADRREIESR